MQVRVLAFAALKDRLGFQDRDLEVPAGATVRDAMQAVFQGPVPVGVAAAVNQEYAGPERLLRPGDELALLPPVSGGAPLFRVSSGPIDLEEVLAAVRDPTCGAVLSFVGTARELAGERLVHLEYEAYAPMAERFFADLAAEIAKKDGVERLAIVHRTGVVKTGEASIAIAVAAPHRGPAFDALRHAIEAIKERAPVWKKEVSEKGGRWLEVEKMEGA